jgi:shikimate kinase
MGAGKTKAGALVAATLDWPFMDVDRLVEERAGLSVAEIFRREGEDGFRRRETEAVRSLASSEPPLVAALGGGVVEREENRNLLGASFFVVWIQIDPREAAKRLAGKPGRPLLDVEDPLEVLQSLAARRSPYYLRLARYTTATEADTAPEELCGRIVESLRRTPPEVR